MNNSSQPGLYQSANSSTSTLRPRATRLISYLDDDTADATAISTSSAPTPPRFPSRGVSPNLINKRTKPSDKSKNGPVAKPSGVATSGSQSPSLGSQGLWESWSSIQGIASSLLGSDTSASGKDKPSTSFKTPLWMKQDRSYGTRQSALQWGPRSAPATSTPGSIEERKARLETKKGKPSCLLLPQKLKTARAGSKGEIPMQTYPLPIRPSRTKMHSFTCTRSRRAIPSQV